MRKRDIFLGLIVTLALAAILLPLAAVFLISTAVLLIPAAPLVAVAGLAVLLALTAGSKQACAAGPPQVDTRPHDPTIR
jgi:hypothetical protein